MSARTTIRESLLRQGVNPYPQDGHRTHTNAMARELGVDELVQVAGRVTAIREHGNMRFFDIEDDTGKIQVVFKADQLESKFQETSLYGVGDFIRTGGTRFDTKRGEKSVLALEFDMLSKAVNQIPDSWVGLKDEETRYRNRSLDMLLNPEVKEVFRKRAAIVASVRSTLNDHDFMEVETPTLQPLYGGANARPFTTTINAWDMQMFLRISPELYLKRLMIGMGSSVYEIVKNFRNEGVDKTHNPEFTMMECYAPYQDYTDMMRLTEQIYRNAALAANGSTTVTFQGTTIDYARPWVRLPMKAGIKQYLGLEVDTMTDYELKNAIVMFGEEYKGEWNRGLGIAKLAGAIEKCLIQPTFLMDMPKETTSLCKPHRDDPSLIERFEPYIMGMEIGNAYTELNDPVLQRQFWTNEMAEDPHPLDEDFLEAMQYGMPPAGGLGLGIDRMVMLLTDQTKIRDVITFPTMRRT